MVYKLIYTKHFDKQLERLDITESRKILLWLDKNVHNSENPHKDAKKLIGDKEPLWRYRIGDYRVIVSIQDSECVVLALKVAHRKEIYKKK